MAHTPPWLGDFVDMAELQRLIESARAEEGRDITSELTIPAGQLTTARMRSRSPGVLAGSALIPEVLVGFAAELDYQPAAADGDPLPAGEVIASFRGSLRDLLRVERVMLNLVGHLSGVATLTAHFVRAIRGTQAVITDTRKTLPGLRSLQKYAVACGGGVNHRMGLHDAVLVKDNHLAHTPLPELAARLAALSPAMREGLKFVEVEVDTLEQLAPVLAMAVDMVLLDNMTLEQLRQAVAMRNAMSPGVQLEASGGVTLDTVREVAQTGVDRIAVGALTHSAPALDVGLDIEP